MFGACDMHGSSLDWAKPVPTSHFHPHIPQDANVRVSPWLVRVMVREEITERMTPSTWKTQV